MSQSIENVVALAPAVACGLAPDRASLAAVLREVADRVEDPEETRILRILIIQEDEDGQVDHGSYGERTSMAEALWLVEKTRCHLMLEEPT